MPHITSRELKDYRDDYCFQVPRLNHSLVADVLPSCSYLPSYIPKHRLGPSHAYIFKLAKETDIYPDDKTTLLWNGGNARGNQPIPEQEVNQIIQEFMSKLHSSKRDKYTLRRIVNVEKKTDPDKGWRYLLEMDLRERATNITVRLSEFVYKFNQNYTTKKANESSSLCYPEGFQWAQDPKVYVIVPVKDYGYWIMYLIDELSKIYANTAERNFHLVLVDFNTTDLDIEEYIQNSALNKSYTLVKMEGPFFKTLAINTGVSAVKDNNSIVFLMDLHITVPQCFFDTIRKHVVKGKAGFFPKVVRLDCGASDLYPQGHWEWMGFGLFGCYKEDWDRFGGEDVEKFRHTWGGEDWDLLDRVCNQKLEAERFCWPKLYHFPHQRKGKFYKEKKT